MILQFLNIICLENPSKYNALKNYSDKETILTNQNDSLNKINDQNVTTEKSETNQEIGYSGKALGISYQVYEGMGSTMTKGLSMSIYNLDENEKRSLAKLGLRLGVVTIYLPNLLKPSAINLRALLWSVFNQTFPETGPPDAGRVGVLMDVNVTLSYYKAIGFVPLGKLALRADIAERLSALIRAEARGGKFKINEAMLSIAGSTKIQMEEILYDLDYIKVAEEPSELVDQIPIIIFERKKKIIKTKYQYQKPKQITKLKNSKKTLKNNSYNKKIEYQADPLSPFAILKSLKVK